jgi:hypothetical protein
MPLKKPPITAEGLRVFLDDPIEGVRVIRSSNGIYQADRKYLCWQPSFYGGSSGAADDDRETVSVRGVRKVHLRVKCTDPRNPPANVLDLAQKEALKLFKTSAVNGATLLASGNQSPAPAALAVARFAVAAPATAQPAPAAEPGGFV